MKEQMPQKQEENLSNKELSSIEITKTPRRTAKFEVSAHFEEGKELLRRLITAHYATNEVGASTWLYEFDRLFGYLEEFRVPGKNSEHYPLGEYGITLKDDANDNSLTGDGWEIDADIEKGELVIEFKRSFIDTSREEPSVLRDDMQNAIIDAMERRSAR